MLASGVFAGLIAGIAFGGDIRRLSRLTLRWWPLLVVASALRLATFFFPSADFAIYVAGISGIGLVAAFNWRIAGSPLIAVGTFANLLVIVMNSGMPYDPATALSVGAPVPIDSLHVVIDPQTRLPFLSDVIPFGVGRAVYSIGDLLIAFGGFLIPFIWLQDEAEASSHDVRSANFAFFWLAQVVSRFGDPITLVALTFVTYRATHSALLTAIAVGVANIPNALLGFFGGAIADRLGPRRAMLWCDIARTVIVGAIPALLAFEAPLVFIFALALLAGAAGAVFAPARGAVIPALLKREHLAQGNSLVYASDRAVEIGGALAGGALVATIGDGAFYVDALTFALSAILLARVAIREEHKRVTWRRVWQSAADGLRFLRESAVLWSNTVFSLVAQLANPIVNTLTPVLLIRRFAGNDPVSGAVLYAGSEAAIALGAVIGSAALPRYLARIRKGTALIVGFGSTGLIVASLSIAPSYVVALGLFGLLGFVNVLFFVPNVTLMQERTPPEKVASVFGARIALANLTWLPLIFLGGAVGDLVGVEQLFVIAGLITLLTALSATAIPAIRDVE